MNKPILTRSGDTYWYNENGELHRIDGPACEYSNGSKYWYQNGLRHRIDGPAIEYPDGRKFYCINGIFYTTLEAGLMDQALE